MTIQGTITPTQTRTFVKPSQITRAEDMTFRKGRTDRAHVATLLNALRITGELYPVLLWKENHDEFFTGRLILLDGMHRIEAHVADLRGKVSKAKQRVMTQPVPAQVHPSAIAFRAYQALRRLNRPAAAQKTAPAETT